VLELSPDDADTGTTALYLPSGKKER